MPPLDTLTSSLPPITNLFKFNEDIYLKFLKFHHLTSSSLTFLLFTLRHLHESLEKKIKGDFPLRRRNYPLSYRRHTTTNYALSLQRKRNVFTSHRAAFFGLPRLTSFSFFSFWRIEASNNATRFLLDRRNLIGPYSRYRRSVEVFLY